MRIQAKHPVSRVLLACQLPIVATILQWQLKEYLPPFAWLFLYPAIFFSSRVGGKWGGLWATAIAIPLGVYFFFPPELSFEIIDSKYFYAIMVFGGMGVLFSLFHGRLEKLELELQQQAQSTLESVESQLNMVLSLTQTGVWQQTIAPNGIAASNAAKNLHQLSKITGIISLRQWLTTIHPDDRASVIAKVKGNVKSGQSFNLEYRVVNHMHSNVCWVLVAAESQQNEQTFFQTYEGIIVDITEQKRLVLEKEKLNVEFNQLAEAMPQIVWACDPLGGITYFNRQWVDYTGLSLAESYCAGWNILFHPDDQKLAWQAWQDAVNHEKVYTLECRLRRHDGEYRWWLIRGVAYRDATGNVEKWFGTCTDIHDLKMKQNSLKDSEFRWQFALEGSHQGVWDWDIPSGKVFFSNRWKAMLGYSEKMIGDGLEEWSSRVHPDDLPAVMLDVDRHLKGETNYYQNEHRVRSRQGEYLWILDRGMVVNRDANGNALRMIGTHTDISEQISNLNALKDSEAMLNLFLNHNPIIAWVKDAQGRHVYLNNTYEKRFGVKLEDWKGKTDFDTWPQAVALQFQANDQAILKSGQACEVVEQTYTTRGESVFWRNFKFPFKNQAGDWFIGGIGIDETKTIQTQQQLFESERFLADSQRIAHIGSWRLALSTDLIDWSEETFRIFGLPVSTAAPTLADIYALIHFEDRVLVEKWTNHFREGQSPAELEYRIERQDGQIRWLLAYGAVELDSQGNPQEVTGTIQDVTNRMQTQTQLMLLGEALEASANAVVITDPDGVIEWVNNGFVLMSGYGQREIIGTTFNALLTPSADPNIYNEIWQNVLSGNVWSGELINRHKDGRTFPVEQVLTPILDKYKKVAHVIAIKKDITVRKDAEIALKNSLLDYQKLSHHLETIREEERIRIAREIHDELGGFLTALKMDLAMFIKKIPDQSSDCLQDAESMKNDIHQGLKAIKRIINDLRPSVLDHLGLIAAIEWLADSLLKPAGIKFFMTKHDELLDLSHDRATAIFRIAQESMVNIIKHANASEVMVKLIECDRKFILHISDNGHGIKESNVINGFGITGMRERARHFGGSVAIDFSDVEGTTVIVILPLDDEPAQVGPNPADPILLNQ